MISDRLDRLKNYMAEAGLSGLAVNAGPTLTYLSGLHFHLMERPVVMVLPLDAAPVLILPKLEERKLLHLPYPALSFSYPEDPGQWQGVFSAALARIDWGGGRLGVEPRQLRLLELQYLQAAGVPEVADATSQIAALRCRKESAEIALMQQAVCIAEQSLEATLPMVRIGCTEREVAAELTMQLFRHGADPVLPFSPIVASGSNCANPHAIPGEKRLEIGDLLIIDWGAGCQGYYSDLTRTFAIAEIDGESERIHRLVQTANRAGRQAGGPGVACAAIDRAAREVIEESGYGDFFTHRTGHGIGLECHEDPYIRGDNQQILQPGMTYTVEPGIYLPGRNGVRIEDDVVVEGDGCRSLSTMSREIRVLG